MTPRVGILALQGAVEPHRAALAALGVRAREVRTGSDLEELTHLVLPGGESTTIRHLLDLFGMTELLRHRHASGELALLGTCAGAILLGRLRSARPRTLAILDAEFERNAYGTQSDSFVHEVALDLGGVAPERMRTVFIRAPRILAVGAGVRVLARLGEEPVALEAPGILATTFHPELSGSTALHARFLELAAPRFSARADRRAAPGPAPGASRRA